MWSRVLSLFMSEALFTQPGGISLHYTYIQHQLIKILTDSFYPPASRAALRAQKAVLWIWIRSDPKLIAGSEFGSGKNSGAGQLGSGMNCEFETKTYCRIRIRSRKMHSGSTTLADRVKKKDVSYYIYLCSALTK
jgi:hypothetical protein